MQEISIGRELLMVPMGRMLQANALLGALAKLRNLRKVELGFLLTVTDLDWPFFFLPLPLMTQIKCEHNSLARCSLISAKLFPNRWTPVPQT